MNRLSHALRAVPWLIVMGAAVPGAVLSIVAFTFHDHQWSALLARGGLLLLAVPAAFLLDDAPASVTTASPRSPWWDLSCRLLGLVMICAGVGVLAWWWTALEATPQPWLMWFFPCAAAVTAVGVAALLRERGRNTPGDLVAAGLAFALLGLALFRPAYRSWELLPFPGDAGAGEIAFWAVLIALAIALLLWAAGHRAASPAVDA